MATGPITQISDVIVPEIFTPYTQQLTEQKSRLIQSGALVRDSFIDGLLAGGGNTFDVPSYRDLDDDEENISSDEAADRFVDGQNTDSKPKKIQTAMEVAVRLSRNNSWSSADLAATLAGNDPMDAISNLVAGYWTRRIQSVFIATVRGIYADNAAAPIDDEHEVDDMTNDISGAAYSAGTTDFSAPAFLDAAVTMGDSMEDLGLVLAHSIVYNRMQKNNLIDFIPDARGETRIPTFLGRIVVVDDSMPSSGGVYETWLFGAGAIRMGMGSPKVPTAVEREEAAGQGGGQEILYNRVMWTLHPVGHAYEGAASGGGPSNAATANNIAHADSWKRVFTERKQIKMARLVTREHAA